jgi:hypothetical protein
MIMICESCGNAKRAKHLLVTDNVKGALLSEIIFRLNLVSFLQNPSFVA